MSRKTKNSHDVELQKQKDEVVKERNEEEWHIRISNYDKETIYTVECYGKTNINMLDKVKGKLIKNIGDGKLYKLTKVQFLEFAKRLTGNTRNITEETRNKRRENLEKARQSKNNKKSVDAAKDAE